MTGPHASAIHEYWHDIETGQAVVGKWVRLLYERILSGLQHEEYYLDPAKANKAIRFIENFCHHSEGRNDLIKLETWQRAFVTLLFGIVDRYGVRQFREVFLVIGRKNGKTLLAAAIAACMAYIDGEYGAREYFVAPKLEQACLCYNAFYQMINAEPELLALAKKRRSDIYIEATNSMAKPIAFSEKRSDGLNISLCVADEIASWPAATGLKMYEVLKSSFGSRLQPVLLSISTAGYVDAGPFDELMARATAFLQGSSEERRLLPLLYMIDDQDKWDDLEELRKSNPNMGVSVAPSFFLEEIAVAKNSLPKKLEYLTKYCNLKQASVAAFLPYSVVDACTQEAYSLEDFRSSYCVAGIDLSQAVDLTAASVVIERAGRLYTFCHFWMPAAKIDEMQARDGVPYRIFEQQGLLSPSGENFVDYQDVFAWFNHLVEDLEILPLVVGYDRYSSMYLIQSMQQYGYKCDDVFQGYNLSPVIQEAEGLLRDGTLQLGQNNLLKAHFLNVALKQNTENRKYQAVKIDPRCHIDGFVSVLDALTVRQKWYDQIGDQLKNND